MNQLILPVDGSQCANVCRYIAPVVEIGAKDLGPREAKHMRFSPSGRGYDRYRNSNCVSGRGYDCHPSVDCTSGRSYDRHASVERVA